MSATHLDKAKEWARCPLRHVEEILEKRETFDPVQAFEAYKVKHKASFREKIRKRYLSQTLSYDNDNSESEQEDAYEWSEYFNEDYSASNSSISNDSSDKIEEEDSFGMSILFE